ncbi:hypothetical protein F511_32687 [Dorcoceras hygrometricum]|uniref:Dystroglycan-like n=1 Tax=Dorcoceras hygrometricum TaxID=472368 RepID=A0A2Z7B021_9LAMI|nr:hypothetical protein F511_32687 [Dorcoceras hygrometricum]
MASSLFFNTVHVCFESVLAMDNAGMVAMFESLVATGLKGFLGCPAVIHEAALLEFFQNGSVRDGLVVSTVNGVTVEISEQLFAETFELSVECLTDLSEIPKDIVFDAWSIVSLSGEPAGSFDAITQEMFLMMAAITCGVKINWNRLLFNILKDMVTTGSRQAKGYAIQISLLLENVPNLELGESSEFPSSKILTEKTVHRYVVLNDNVGVEDVTDEPRMKKTPVKRAASKKRPAVTTAAEPVVKKKRLTKSKPGSSKDKLEILPVAQEAVPLQIIEPTAAAPTKQPPSAPKCKIQKRKRRLLLGSDDESVEQPAAEVAGETVFEESAVAKVLEEQQRGTIVDDFVAVPEDTVVEGIAEPVSEPAVADIANAHEAMSLEDILMTIPVECSLPSAYGEITPITLGKSISIPGVHEGGWYKAGLPKIPATDKGKAPLMERDPVKGNPIKEQFSLIVADIDLLMFLYRARYDVVLSFIPADNRYVDVSITVERCVDDVDFTVHEEDATSFELVATPRIDVAAGSSRGLVSCIVVVDSYQDARASGEWLTTTVHGRGNSGLSYLMHLVFWCSVMASGSLPHYEHTPWTLFVVDDSWSYV